MEKEHNGEKAIAMYKAKMVSSNSEHYDFVSTLMLTDQHLYVLEDNGDGSYAEYFSYEISEIDDIEVQRVEPKSRSNQQIKRGIARVFTDVVMGFMGYVRTSLIQPDIQESWNFGHLIIMYHTKQGQNDRRYFQIGSQEPDDFLRAFRKLRESYLLY